MGIPHLITYLRPYAELQSLAGKDVIIDGPGLCYHIHHKYLSQRDGRNALSLFPTYEELGKAVLKWLDGLRGVGAAVRSIYFDGFLPPAKLKTRLERLQKQTRQWTDYHNAHTAPCQITSNNCETVPISEGQPSHPTLTRFPLPPPFLVPAILETLKNSKDYKDVTEVVPGEADLYCARYVKDLGGVVLTGDSDLLVHDLGNGAVSFFSDIQPVDEKHGYLGAQIYRTTAISERLGLLKSHGIRSLAFEMFLDNHGTFSRLVSQATSLKSIKAWGSLYEEFSTQYTSEVEQIGDERLTQTTFQYLDPRISEIVLQFLDIAKLARQDVGADNLEHGTSRVFLPFLLDCPIRTSAWEISTSVRQLAYGLLNLVVPEIQQHSTVIEHRRQQQNASGREWQLPSLEELPDACMAILSRLKQLENLNIRPSDRWLAVMICQDVEWSTSFERLPLTQVVMGQLCDLQEHKQKCTWDIIHFLAQIQGSYYSFRILKQILEVISSYSKVPLPNTVQQLNGVLGTLFGFYEVPHLGDAASVYRKVERNNLLNIARKFVGIEEPGPVLLDGRFTKAARKKRKRHSIVIAGEISSIKGRSLSKNPFDLLEVE